MAYTPEELERMRRNLGITDEEIAEELKKAEEERYECICVRKYPETDGHGGNEREYRAEREDDLSEDDFFTSYTVEGLAEAIVSDHIEKDYIQDKKVITFKNKIWHEYSSGESLDNREWSDFRKTIKEMEVGTTKYNTIDINTCFKLYYGA